MMNLSKYLNTVLVALLAGSLMACSAPYKRQDQGISGTGYDDVRIGPNQYRISVTGSGFTSYDRLGEYFHRRAGELCRDEYSIKEVRQTKTTHATNFTAGGRIAALPRILPVVEGEVYCSEDRQRA